MAVRKKPARALVPMVFEHMCCNAEYVFGQDANGDNVKRRVDAPGSQPWETVVPALGAPVTKRRGVSITTKPTRTKRSRGRVG